MSNKEIILRPQENSKFHNSKTKEGIIPKETLDSLWPESALFDQKYLDSYQPQNTIYTTQKFDISSLNEKVRRYIQMLWNQKYQNIYYIYLSNKYTPAIVLDHTSYTPCSSPLLVLSKETLRDFLEILALSPYHNNWYCSHYQYTCIYDIHRY